MEEKIVNGVHVEKDVLQVCIGGLYVIFFFSDELRKFSISDFPKQTHFGHILITIFFFLHPLTNPHIDIVFQLMA